MQIDVIADFVCPWCFIGRRRLARAMASRPNIAFDVKHRPYRLDPSLPREGMDRKAYLAARFPDGKGLIEAHRIIAQEGEKEGIAFAWDAIERAPSTIDAHRLARWAEAWGAQDDVAERLFAAYFENGDDIGNIRVLADIADISGMDGAEIANLLETDTDIANVEREDQLAREMGVTGVPAMIFGGKIAVTGAREPDILLTAIDKAAETGGGEPES
jgi:predicted DsbA family dithiol-disulfide isomerase